MLGSISVLTVGRNSKRQAIHDSLAGSVVVFANPKLRNPVYTVETTVEN